MRSPAYLAQPNIHRLPSLLRDIQEGEIRIPRFQRPFVWTEEQRLDLFRSIYDGIPIGSILIWRTKNHVLRCYSKLGRLPLSWYFRGENEEERQVRQYVIDGHQRLVTLFDALGPGLASSDQVAEAAVAYEGYEDEDSQSDEIRPIYFDLEERTFRIHRRSGTPPDTWLPLAILLDPYKLFEFQKRLLDRGADRALTNRAEALASTFKDYSVPVVPIATENLELATESFQRVNSGGTPMSEVHMVSALAWTPEFDLNERMREAQTRLGEVGWQDLDEKMILNTCKALLDLDIYYAEAKEIRDHLKDRPEVLEEATASLQKAARFLREHCWVYGPAVLPYSFQIVLLADALRSVEEPISETLQDVLTRWFWITTYSEYFAGISAVRLAKALEHLRNVIAHGKGPEPPGFTWKISLPRRFDFRTARSRAIALRMAERQAGLLRYDPYRLLANHGRNAMPMIVPREEASTAAIEGPENRFLIPPKAISRFRSAIMHGALSPRLLKAHLISFAAAEALSKENFPEFLRLRRRDLLSQEAAFIGKLSVVITHETP